MLYQKSILKILTVGFIISTVCILVPGKVLAQAVIASTTPLVNVTSNLYFGTRGGGVIQLQNFLIQKGFLRSNLNTGFFGFSTVDALRRYQTSVGVPGTGLFGPMTRTFISNLYKATSTPDLFPPATDSPRIASIFPTEGPIGATIQVYGTGFRTQNTVKFGPHFAENISANGGVLRFTVPGYINPCGPNMMCNAAVYLTTPGQYVLNVSNIMGSSNSIPFNVIATTTSINLNLTATTTGDRSIHVNASFIPESHDSHTVTLRATCPSGVSVVHNIDGVNVCDTPVTMPVIVGPGTYKSVFTFNNPTSSMVVVYFNASTGPLTASTKINLPSTATVPPVVQAPSASLVIKGQACTYLGGQWSTTPNSVSGAVGTCMFNIGGDLRSQAVQQFSCKQMGGTFNSCLSSCSSASATATMCAAVCTPGCTGIR